MWIRKVLSQRSVSLCCVIACTFAAMGVTTSAIAQVYPDRPIKMLQGFAPGGNADTIARLIGAELSKSLAQPVVIETKTGAGGTIASDAVAKAKADGHTLLLATGGHVVAGALYASLPYQTVDSFEPVSTITFFPFLMVVKSDSKLTGVRDLVAASNANPKGLSFGSAGVGSTHHLTGELFAKAGGARLVHVAYRGDAASLVGLLGDEVDFIIAPATAVLSNIVAGKLRAVATTGPGRWPGLPQVATVAEQGVAGFDVRSWAGVLAPAGTAPAIVELLSGEVNRALTNVEVRSALEKIGGEAKGSTSAQMRAMMVSELRRWTQLVDEARIPRQ